MICEGSILRLRAWTAAPAHVPLYFCRARLSVTADSQTSKDLARAVKAVKVKVITVSKGNSKGTDIVAGGAVLAAPVIVQCFTLACYVCIHPNNRLQQVSGVTRSGGTHSLSTCKSSRTQRELPRLRLQCILRAKRC